MIIYLTITDKSFASKQAFGYLAELAAEFDKTHGEAALSPQMRPYGCARFDSFLSKTASVYADSRTAPQNSLDRLNEDLQDVTRVMTKNMEDLLWRGHSLDRMSNLSNTLRDESIKYRNAARKVNTDALIRKWAPVGGVILFLIIIIWYRSS